MSKVEKNVSSTQTDDHPRQSSDTSYSKHKIKYSASAAVAPSMDDLFKRWTDVSLINFLTEKSEISASVRRRSIGLPQAVRSVFDTWEPQIKSDIIREAFPVNTTPLMNEENKWGCFYPFPEIYADIYSPVVGIRELKDVPPIEGGVLTRDLVTACLTYLRRTPILGDYAYIKLNLSSKQLSNINVLKHYKHLVYLDLSSNLLQDLSVLSYLPYLQYLSVAYNRLSSILDYDTPQWFLTEVHYKFNSICKINDLSAFWSITILDLSHNNIKFITGLDTLRYLRQLDLSFNHIQRLENLNHLRLVWLDISYNNISNCEFGENVGLWTLLHLEYLNLNENNLVSLRMLSGCNRLRELHLRNNRLTVLLELAVYTKQMRRLVVLDLRANPLCTIPKYKDVVLNTFPLLLSLDAEGLDPVEQRTVKMAMFPDVTAHATRRLLRLLYIQQLSRSLVSPFAPPADTTDVPLVVIVGLEAIGKGSLVRRLTTEYKANMQLARQHTTATCHFSEHFIEVTRNKFDEMLLAGEFLTYSEMDGESYGLSRSEADIKDGKVRVASMDLLGALMLKLRGYRPYLILATTQDQRELAKRQYTRKTYREMYHQQLAGSEEVPMERSTLQVLVSGRIIIRGILNSIILNLPDENVQSDFTMGSNCSLMLDSDMRDMYKEYTRDINFLNSMLKLSTALFDDAQIDMPPRWCEEHVVEHHKLLGTVHSDLSLQDENKHPRATAKEEEPSLYSLFKDSQTTEEYNSFLGYGQETLKKPRRVNQSFLSQGVDFSRYASSTWKGLSGAPIDSAKSAKSVTFTSQDNTGITGIDPTGMIIEPQKKPTTDEGIRSISTRGPMPAPGHHTQYDHFSIVDSDLWLAFLTEAGQMEASEIATRGSKMDPAAHNILNVDEAPQTMMRDIRPLTVPFETKETLESAETLSSAHVREEFASIHRRSPGLFWDTVCMDNPEEAFKKIRGIIQKLVENQSKLKPMFDIDFANLEDYPSVQQKLDDIRKQIAPQRLFY